ncbi:MAG TPA: hypothetical protein VGJ13_05125 [Pseudonocardiaceae bacterium]|jgi:hypothetical protein
MNGNGYGPIEYRITFCGRYPREQHPSFPAADHDGWLVVLAWAYQEAQQTANRVLGSEWCNIYAPHYASYQAMAQYYPKGELGFLDSTVPPSRQEVTRR